MKMWFWKNVFWFIRNAAGAIRLGWDECGRVTSTKVEVPPNLRGGLK